MMPNQKQGGGTVVDHSGRFAHTGEREAVLEINRARTASAAGKIELQIVIVRRDLGDVTDSRRAQRCPTEICMENNSGPVNDQLET